MSIEIRTAEDPESINAARTLVRVHMLLAQSVAQVGPDIERAIGELPAPYVAPRGCLWLAWDGTDAVGCLALHELAPGVGELKRMYVRPASRGQGVARQLTERAIATAVAFGYARLRLGTLPSMHAAQRLYESLGFRRIAAYRPVEFGETWFYECALGAPAS